MGALRLILHPWLQQWLVGCHKHQLQQGHQVQVQVQQQEQQEQERQQEQAVQLPVQQWCPQAPSTQPTHSQTPSCLQPNVLQPKISSGRLLLPHLHHRLGRYRHLEDPHVHGMGDTPCQWPSPGSRKSHRQWSWQWGWWINISKGWVVLSHLVLLVPRKQQLLL